MRFTEHIYWVWLQDGKCADGILWKTKKEATAEANLFNNPENVTVRKVKLVEVGNER